ncbi:MAG TPA: glycosyltransferase [Acidimicrobiales bacterium]|nr:glycosyltransferase [Acidimicrobiales bacterium]
MAGTTDLVVLLGTPWSRLAWQNTRWRSILQQWAGDARFASVSVVDFPSMSLRNLVRTRAEPIDSWDDRVTAVAGRVPVYRTPSPLDAVAWGTTGAALSRVLPARGARRVVVAATPLWAPVLRHLDADRRGFDAVDDWRELPVAARVGGHVVRGYRAAARADAVTTVSPELADRLRADFGIDARPVPNGVDVEAYTAPLGDAPPGLPEGPFAVYLGVVQQRVDVGLLAEAQQVLPVVVAGPADDATAQQLRDLGITWIGPVGPDVVPALLRRAAVGLLPHRVNALTTSMSPMKVLEYLAAGLPVAATPVPLTVASDRIVVATDGAYGEAVRDALAHGRLDGPDPAVRAFGWNGVAEALFSAHVGGER